jgi:hypothetical protein
MSEDATSEQRPIPILPGQTVCNRKDAKGKLCAGPLKKRPEPGYRSKTELEGDPVIYRCGRCNTLYVGPPQGFLRDRRMESFVMSEQPEITPPEPKPAHEAPKKD